MPYMRKRTADPPDHVPAAPPPSAPSPAEGMGEHAGNGAPTPPDVVRLLAGVGLRRWTVKRPGTR